MDMALVQIVSRVDSGDSLGVRGECASAYHFVSFRMCEEACRCEAEPHKFVGNRSSCS